MVYSLSGRLYSREMDKLRLTQQRSMGEPPEHDVKPKKPETETHKLVIPLYTKCSTSRGDLCNHSSQASGDLGKGL